MTNIKKRISALMVAVMLMSAFSFVLTDNVSAKTENYKPVLKSVKVWYYGKSGQVKTVKATWTKIYKYRDWKVEYKLHSIGPTKHYTQTGTFSKCTVKDGSHKENVKSKGEAGFNGLQIRFKKKTKKGTTYTKWSNTK